ncbi:MAG: hypothetical protein K2H95_04785 [Bacteroidales bacterium]|nr:hypothetical protein [Bacteroidales bacterium]
MDSPFVYDRYVTGRNFVGRKKECGVLGNLLGAGENVVMFEPPKAGKMSLIQQTMFNMRASGKQFVICCADLFNMRTTEDFLLKFGTAVIKAFATSPDQYEKAVSDYLGGTHFIFDKERYYQNGDIISMNWSVEPEDVSAMLALPYRVAMDKGVTLYVVFNEFQNIMCASGGESLLKSMEELLSSRPSGCPVSFIMTGSRVNAMKYIFSYKKYFHRQVIHLPLMPVEQSEIIEHIVRGFLYGAGKSLDRELAVGACELFKCNMWYINHLASVCDSMSKGYISENIMMDALGSIISVHEPRFMSMVDDLTDHQLSLMRAILDGVVKFSSSDVIAKYRLNSSANVLRVKEALKKKEIVTFNEKDEPLIMDPLFEYWIGRHYFEIQQQ